MPRLPEAVDRGGQEFQDGYVQFWRSPNSRGDLQAFLTVLAAAASPTTADQANAQNRSAPGRWKPAPVRRVMIVVAMRSAEECYRNVCRYLAGVMPVARRNARVKLDSEENRHS